MDELLRQRGQARSDLGEMPLERGGDRGRIVDRLEQAGQLGQPRDVPGQGARLGRMPEPRERDRQPRLRCADRVQQGSFRRGIPQRGAQGLARHPREQAGDPLGDHRLQRAVDGRDRTGQRHSRIVLSGPFDRGGLQVDHDRIVGGVRDLEGVTCVGGGGAW